MAKANQNLKQNDEGVSPVIGVILMVAITVVLAAVVFVLVSNLGKGSEKAPNVSFNKDSSQGTLTVVQADPGVTWDDFNVSGSCITNGAVVDGYTVTSPSATAGSPYTTNVVSGGDLVSGCLTGETFSLTHIATNSLVYSTTF